MTRLEIWLVGLLLLVNLIMVGLGRKLSEARVGLDECALLVVEPEVPFGLMPTRTEERAPMGSRDVF